MLQNPNSDACAVQQKVTSCIGEFAPLPSVAIRVIDMLTDPETSAADHEDVLQGDISPVTSILKI